MAQQDEQQQGGYNQNSNSIEQPSRGLYTDVAPISQPQGTYRFALNAINESEEGDMNTLTNELGNEEYAFLPKGYVPIGSVYVGDNELCIFSTNGTNSEIGLLSDKYSYDNSTVNGKKNNYMTVLNDSLSPFGKKLDFQVNKQIKAVYRLRKGCEKIVYWTDDYNVPRNINLNDVSHYIEENGHLKMNNFNIIKEVKTHIELESAKVVDYKGSLHVGGVKFMIRYVDKNKIPTKFIYESGSYNIYNDKLTILYNNVAGSVDVGKQGDLLKGELSNKALEIKTKHLDTDYPFYQFGFIHYNGLTGIPSEVYLSNLVSTTSNTFLYTGKNYIEKTTIEELELSQEGITIEKAKTIEIKDNRLVLGNVKNKDTNFFKLQRYASKIKTDCVVKKVPMNSIVRHNPKHPSCNIDGTGFKYGEIYSFGIVYLFEGGVESPVFHIPGKINGDDLVLDSDFVTKPENNGIEIYPMSYDKNENLTLKYTEREKCGQYSYWGKDYRNNQLDENVNVRFHRFPTRKKLNKSLIDETNNSDTSQSVYKVVVSTCGFTDEACRKSKIDKLNCLKFGDSYSARPIYINVKYKVDGVEKTKDINYNSLVNGLLIEEIVDNETDPTNPKIEFGDLYISYEKATLVETIEQTTTTVKKTRKVKRIVQEGTKKEQKKDPQGNPMFDPQGNPIMEDVPNMVEKEFDEEYEETNTVETKREYKVISNSGVPLKPNGDFDTSGNPNYDVRIVNSTNNYEGDSKNGVRKLTNTKSVALKERIPFIDNGTEKPSGYNNAFYSNTTNIIYNKIDTFKDCDTGIDIPASIFYAKIVKEVQTDSTKKFGNNMLGVHFSNIELPSKDITGLNCLGYYIVKQKIKDKDKTILDSCVLIPTITWGSFTASSVMDLHIDRPSAYYRPNDFSNKSFNVIAMSNKYYGTLYEGFSHLRIVGCYKPKSNTVGGYYINDVVDGKEDNADNESNYTKDDDGVDLKGIIRDTEVIYENFNKEYLIPKDKIDVNFNNPYSYQYTEETKEYLCNLDMINTALFFSMKDKVDTDLQSQMTNDGKKYLFGYIERDNQDFYEDFRTAEYEKMHSEFSNEDTITNYNGGNFVGGYRHTTSSYLRTTERAHAAKGSATNFLKIVGGAILVVAGAIFTGGTVSMVGSVLIAGAIGSGAYLMTTGVIGMVKQSDLDKLTGELYEKGLKNTFGDDLFFYSFVGKDDDTEQRPFADNAILVYGQVIGDFIFESDINFPLRVELKDKPDNFIRPFTNHMSDHFYNIRLNWANIRQGGDIDEQTINNILEATQDRGGNNKVQRAWNGAKAAVNKYVGGLTEFSPMYAKGSAGDISDRVYKFFINKACKTNPDRKEGYQYRGTHEPIVFIANRDYSVTSNIKKYHMIPFEYTICSECVETFSQRFYWSEKDNVESIDDSFSRWLPNNYKDISGEYGDIVNIFDFNGRLFIHTTEGLWMQPTNYQERITNGVVSYIGTGEFGSLPAQLIVNDKNGNSAGLQHREATVMTPYGYFFVSEREGTVYKFDGKLTPISDIGISKWFGNNIDVELEGFYRGNIGEEYEYKDNPVNLFGTGFILIWDKGNQRILITKKDFKFKNEDLNKSQTKVVLDKNEIYFVNNFKNIVKALKSVLATPYKTELLNNMLFVDSKGRVVNRTDIEDTISLKYEGIRNKRLVFNGFSSNLDSFVFGYVNAKKVENIDYNDLSWTLSYSLRTNTWISYHSYRPAMYFRMNDNFYSYENVIENNPIFLQNSGDKYQTFYGKHYPYIVEYVNNDSPIVNKIFNHLKVITNAYKYSEEQQEFYEQRYITFNKAMFYNTRQCSGIVNLKVKDLSDMNAYTVEQVVNTNNGVVLIDNNEGDWLINDIRDYVIKYDKPFFNSNKITVSERNSNEFIDKVLEDDTLDTNKAWAELESFRNKFLVVRLIFDNFADVKLVFNFASENNNISNY